MIIHILGGYGGTGRALSRLLLAETNAQLIISGRNLPKAEAFCSSLVSDYPKRVIEAKYADAENKESMRLAFAGADIVIVAATVPDHVEAIAEAVISAGALYMDILVSGSVVDRLQQLMESYPERKPLLITQGGFHPGIIAPVIRHVCRHFDISTKAIVGLAMNAKFDSPYSGMELMGELAEYRPKIVVNGSWKDATYKDMPRISFGDPFGTQACYPMEMREIEPLQVEFNFEEMGVYVAGFNWFVDYFVFPLAMALQKIRKGLGLRFTCWLLYQGINWFSPKDEYVTLQLNAEGMKDGFHSAITFRIEAEDAYWLTAVPVVACLKQYMRGELPASGLQLMGTIVDPEIFMNEMQEMGLKVKSEFITAENPEAVIW